MTVQTSRHLEASFQENEIHLRDYLRVIQRRRSAVVVCAVLIFTVVLMATFLATPIFEAETKILITRSNDDSLNSQRGMVYYDPSFDATQTELIKSFNVASRVVKALKLDTPALVNANAPIGIIAEIKSKIKEFLPGRAPNVIPANFSILEQQAAQIMANISVKTVKESQVFVISYSNRDPIMAKDVANAVAKAYMDEALEMKMHSVGYTLQWMTEKAAEEKAKLEASERQIQQYMADSGVVTLQDKIAILPEQLTDFSAKLSEAVTQLNQLVEIKHKLDQAGEDFEKVDAILDLSTQSNLIKTLSQQLLEAQQKQKDYAKKYGPKHPLMINANSEVNTITSNLETEKKREMTRQLKLFHNKLDLARSQVSSIQGIVDNTKSDVQGFNKKMVQYGILKREVETNRVLYESLLTQIKEKRVTEQTSSVDTWVTDEARTPTYPAKPQKSRNILLGLIFGVFGGFGLAFFLEYLDNTVGSPEDAEAKLGVSVVGVIDYFKQSGSSPDSSSALAEFSAYAEGFKAIRTAILLSAADHPPKRILVTSMLPGEGKTTITVNLARTFGQADYKVLIIDADLRKPRIHKVFAVDNNKGLSTYLAGVEGGDILKQLEGEPNLWVISAGPMPPNPSELLVSNRFKKLLSVLDQKFDFILIDSAPLFSATETMLLSQVANGTLMVAKSGQSTYEVLGAGFKSLKESGVNVLGLVTNAQDRKRSGYGSYYGGRYYKYASYYSETPDKA